MEDVRYDEISFSFYTWGAVPKKSTLGKLTYSRHFQRVVIIATKSEEVLIHFKSDLFVAFAIFMVWSCKDGKEMYINEWRTCKVLVLRNKPIAFLTSSLPSPSPSSLLKLPATRKQYGFNFIMQDINFAGTSFIYIHFFTVLARLRGTQRQFSGKYLFGRRFEN